LLLWNPACAREVCPSIPAAWRLVVSSDSGTPATPHCAGVPVSARG